MPEGGPFIHIVSLNSGTISERRVRDWTGLCSQPEMVKEMHFMISKKDELVVSVRGEIHVLTLNSLVTDEAAHGVLQEGPNTHKGEVNFV